MEQTSSDPQLLKLEFPLSAESVPEIWKRIRGYVENENQLIHNRATGLVQIQSFMIAAFGFLVGKCVDFAGGHSLPLLTRGSELAGWLLILVATIVMSALGYALSHNAKIAIGAAIDAIQLLKHKWNIVRYRLDPEARAELDIQYPFVTSGGTLHDAGEVSAELKLRYEDIHLAGHRLLIRVPDYFRIFWVVTAIMLGLFIGWHVMACLLNWHPAQIIPAQR